jgi:hypothetical protein
MAGVPIAITDAPRLCRWVAVVTLALGLVAMHHLVGTHTHAGGSQDSSPGMTMLVPAVENYASSFGGAAVVPARPGTDGGLMLHLCQAVLTGLVLLTELSLAWRLIPASQPGPSASELGEPANRQRGPPTSLRLAYLGVLRL